MYLGYVFHLSVLSILATNLWCYKPSVQLCGDAELILEPRPNVKTSHSSTESNNIKLSHFHKSIVTSGLRFYPQFRCTCLSETYLNSKGTLSIQLMELITQELVMKL